MNKFIAYLRSFFFPSCDLAYIPRKYGSWFYLNPNPEIVNVGIGKYEIYVTMRGDRGLYYEDPDYWQKIKVTKLGKKTFDISQVEKIYGYIMNEYCIAHSDHG